LLARVVSAATEPQATLHAKDYYALPCNTLCYHCHDFKEKIMSLATMSIRVDADLKKQVEAFCADVGMNPSTAVNLFFKAMIRENRLPFAIQRDPFYTGENLSHLRRSIAQAESGKVTPHEPIQVE
jgi:DNA-damage-inducible protein J